MPPFFAVHFVPQQAECPFPNSWKRLRGRTKCIDLRQNMHITCRGRSSFDPHGSITLIYNLQTPIHAGRQSIVPYKHLTLNINTFPHGRTKYIGTQHKTSHPHGGRLRESPLRVSEFLLCNELIICVLSVRCDDSSHRVAKYIHIIINGGTFLK